ncbi:protein transport sec24b-like protein, partial [Nannochloropsis gaditana CCMP526]|uniref:protein transport sec24b-like protein n=1 Tax=Nannochloropsis gaditana (strain CCMP526) TaxID=1093141 RepID=UPI00029F6CB5
QIVDTDHALAGPPLGVQEGKLEVDTAALLDLLPVVEEFSDEGLGRVQGGQFEFFGRVDDTRSHVVLEAEADGGTDLHHSFLGEGGGEGVPEGREEGGREGRREGGNGRGGGWGRNGPGEVMEASGRHVRECPQGAQIQEIGKDGGGKTGGGTSGGRDRGRGGVADENVEANLPTGQDRAQSLVIIPKGLIVLRLRHRSRARPAAHGGFAGNASPNRAIECVLPLGAVVSGICPKTKSTRPARRPRGQTRRPR